jgi:hypothetical protein
VVEARRFSPLLAAPSTFFGPVPPTPGRTVLRTLPRLLPPSIIGDGDADTAIGDLRDLRPFPGLDQALGRPDGKAADFGPLWDGHHALIIQRAIAFLGLKAATFYFA